MLVSESFPHPEGRPWTEGTENKVLRRVFESKAEKQTGGWRKLPFEDICNLHFSPNIIRITRSRRAGVMGGIYSTQGYLTSLPLFTLHEVDGRKMSEE
jgi:hypothetical protein